MSTTYRKIPLFKHRLGTFRIAALLLGIVLVVLGLLALFSGCASVHPTANLSALNVAPQVTLDGNSLDKVERFAGDVKATIQTHVVHGAFQKTIVLRSDTFWSWLSSFGVWYFVGGLSIVLGLLGLLLRAFKWPSVGYRASGVLVLFGVALLVGVTILKLFWGYMLVILALGAFVFGIEWALHHQSAFGCMQISWGAIWQWMGARLLFRKPSTPANVPAATHTAAS